MTTYVSPTAPQRYQIQSAIIGAILVCVALGALALKSPWEWAWQTDWWYVGYLPGIAWHPTPPTISALVFGVLATSVLAGTAARRPQSIHSPLGDDTPQRHSWRPHSRSPWWVLPTVGAGLFIATILALAVWSPTFTQPPLWLRLLFGISMLTQLVPAGLLLHRWWTNARHGADTAPDETVSWRHAAGSVLCPAMIWPMAPLAMTWYTGSAPGVNNYVPDDTTVEVFHAHTPVYAGAWVVACLLLLLVWPMIRHGHWAWQVVAVLGMPFSAYIHLWFDFHSDNPITRILVESLVRGGALTAGFCGALVLAVIVFGCVRASAGGMDTTALRVYRAGAIAIATPWSISSLLVGYAIPFAVTFPSASILAGVPMPTILVETQELLGPTVWKISGGSIWQVVYLLGGPLLLGWGLFGWKREAQRSNTRAELTHHKRWTTLWRSGWIALAVGIVATVLFAANNHYFSTSVRALFAIGAVCCAAVIVARVRASAAAIPWALAVLALPNAPTPWLLVSCAAVASVVCVVLPLVARRTPPQPK